MDKVIKSIELYYTDGGSDKRYNAQLVKNASGGFVVNYQYGKRGSNLRNGTKTESPLSEAEATFIYEKLLRDQFKQGYTTDVSGKPHLGNQDGRVDSGFKPQLPKDADEDQLEYLLDSPHHIIEEKYDGENTSVDKKSGLVNGINKLGLVKDLPDHLVEVFKAFNDPHLLVSGELVEKTFLYVFDVTRISDKNGAPIDLTKQTYANRKAIRDELVERLGSAYVFSVEGQVENKREFLESVRARNGEGVVFKDLRADHEAGKKHDSQYKHKFYKECSVIVGPKNKDVRSVGIRLYDDSGNLTDVGNVTIPPNVDVPAEGSILETRYLYAYEGGSLAQPTYKELRTDVLHEECKLDQLTYKAEHSPPPVNAKIRF